MSKGRLRLSEASALDADEARVLFAPLAHLTHLLVAVSGGPDSLALLVLLADWCGQSGRPRLSAATVDHGLRPGAAAEAREVARQCALRAVPHATLVWSGIKPRSGVQQAARVARYRLLTDHGRMIGADALLTAHTLDDQAETVLIRLAAGSGPLGLAAMRARVTTGGMAHFRPLLSVPKTRLVATCAARGLAAALDPANHDPRFARGRWRGLMPHLAAEGLDAHRLGLLARRAGQVADLVRGQAAQLCTEAQIDGRADHIDAGLVLAGPEAVGIEALALIIGANQPPGPDPGDPAGPTPERSRPEHTRLERLESLHAALGEAYRAGRPLRRSLAGLVLTLDREGRLRLAPERPRRRGHSRAGRDALP